MLLLLENSRTRIAALAAVGLDTIFESGQLITYRAERIALREGSAAARAHGIHSTRQSARALRAETDLAFARSVRFGFAPRRFGLEARESLGVLDERVIAFLDCGVGSVNGLPVSFRGRRRRALTELSRFHARIARRSLEGVQDRGLGLLIRIRARLAALRLAHLDSRW